MTAQLNVIGTGRVLHHPELVGRSLCYFLSLDFAGRTFRWCFPSARDVWVTEEDGEQYHFQGMDLPQMSQAFDFDSDSPVDISVGFEDLPFPGDMNVAALVALGHKLELCSAELAALPDHAGAIWAERQIVLRGKVQEPIYGDPGTPGNYVSFTVDSPPWEDTALFPPDDWVLDAEVWPGVEEQDVGRVAPFIFGSPGRYLVTDGTGTTVESGTPAIHVGSDIVMIAGHLVADDTLDTGTFPTLTVHGSDMGDQTPSNQSTWTNVGGVLTNSPSNGFKFTAVELTSPSVTAGEEFWVRNWAEVSTTPGVGFPIGQGGYPDFEWNNPLRTAGDVLFYMLLQSSLQVDRGRTAVAQALLQGFIVGGYIDERVSPYEWVTDNLLPILPVALSQGPNGIFPIVWRYDAGPNDCVCHFIEGPRWRRVSGLERDESKITNEVMLRYALDGGSSYKQTFGISGALSEPSDGTTRSSMVVPNHYARRSFLDHGLFSEELSSDVVWDRETAAAICAWKIRANAFAKRIVTYEAPAEHAWLEPGDPIMVTDPDLYFDAQVCLVRTKRWDVTSVIYELMILTDPARDVVVVEAPAGEESELIETEEQIILFETDMEGLDVEGEIYDWGDLAGNLWLTGSAFPTDGDEWYNSPLTSMQYFGDGGFYLEDSGAGPPPYDTYTTHSQAFQIGTDPDFIFSRWVYPDGPGANPRVIWSHENAANSYIMLRYKADGRVEWVKAESGSEVVIVTSTTALGISEPNHVVINMHDGFTAIGIDGTWEDVAEDHTDYNQFSSGVGDGSVRFGYSDISGAGGDNFIGLEDDIQAVLNAYYDDVTVGGTYAVPATVPIP